MFWLRAISKRARRAQEKKERHIFNMMLCSDFTFAAAPHNGAHTHTRALVCPAKACFLFHAIFKFKHSARGAAGRFAFLFASLTCGEQKKLALPRVFWTDKMPRGVSRQAHPSCFFTFAAHFYYKIQLTAQCIFCYNAAPGRFYSNKTKEKPWKSSAIQAALLVLSLKIC